MISKLLLNSLYGKFATATHGASQKPYIEDGILSFKNLPEEERNGVYLPMGIFITSYAREKTIRTSQAIKTYSINKYGKDLYCYSDTDSIHCLMDIEELKQFCEIDKVELGKWKHESTFQEAKFVRQKCYVEKIDNKYEVTCAGLPKTCLYTKPENDNILYYHTYGIVNNKIEEVEKEFKLEDFKIGFVATGKLTYKHVKGGVKLIETDFSIKEKFLTREGFNNVRI